LIAPHLCLIDDLHLVEKAMGIGFLINVSVAFLYLAFTPSMGMGAHCLVGMRIFDAGSRVPTQKLDSLAFLSAAGRVRKVQPGTM